ncbi:MAG: GYD domain-containing protein [Acidobacteriota bacterium]
MMLIAADDRATCPYPTEEADTCSAKGNARQRGPERLKLRVGCRFRRFGSMTRMYTCRDRSSPVFLPGGEGMPSYLLQVSYAADALKKLIAKPQDRGEMVRKAIEKLGGTATGTWLSFGDYDIVSLFELPDNVTAASFALAIAAGGSVKAVKTTPLLSMEEEMAALKKAGASPYKPVGRK